MRLSKSKLLSYRQCPKRLWLEVHRPELVVFDEATKQRFATGHEVGEVARQIYGDGDLIETGRDMNLAVQQTKVCLEQDSDRPIYEATFRHESVLIRADVLLRDNVGLRIIEVKSSTSVKPPYLPDCAIQSWVIRGAGYPLASISLAHINNQFVYAGDGQYDGLLIEANMTDEAEALSDAVPAWVNDAKQVINSDMPDVPVGAHCSDPYDCPFISHCWPEPAEYPLSTLPRVGKLAAKLEAEGYSDVRDIPAGRLDKPLHVRVHSATISGQPVIDPELSRTLRELPYPRHYLDFETIAFAVPKWAGTRPYQQQPFQWSLHSESESGELLHREFLDTTGESPMRACMETLIKDIGIEGPILVYSSFEKTVLNNMAIFLPDLAKPIAAIVERLFDLLPPVRAHYYHPAMKGSWSIKAVLPTVVPHLDYGALEEVADGGAAQRAYLEIIDPATAPERRENLTEKLIAYCKLDTRAMVELVRNFSDF